MNTAFELAEKYRAAVAHLELNSTELQLALLAASMRFALQAANSQNPAVRASALLTARHAFGEILSWCSVALGKGGDGTWQERFIEASTIIELEVRAAAQAEVSKITDGRIRNVN